MIILGNHSNALLDIYADSTKTNNAVAIGNAIDLSQVSSNSVVIGNDKTTGTDGGTNVGIGVYEPKAKLDINGAVKVGSTPRACDDDTRGVIRYVGGNFEGCTANGWKILNNQ